MLCLTEHLAFPSVVLYACELCYKVVSIWQLW